MAWRSEGLPRTHPEGSAASRLGRLHSPWVALWGRCVRERVQHGRHWALSGVTGAKGSWA